MANEGTDGGEAANTTRRWGSVMRVHCISEWVDCGRWARFTDSRGDAI